MTVGQGSVPRVFRRQGGGDPGWAAPRRPPAATGLWSVVGFLVVLEFASGVLQGWISPLLPGILAQYRTTAADLNWIGAVFLLSSAVCVPLMSRLGDRYGHRRMLIVAAALVATGSVLVAVAPTFGVLLVGRAVQGPLLAFLPLEFAILRERAGERTDRAIGLLTGALVIGASLGLLLAGVTRQYLSLTATLWVPAVVMIVAVPVAALLVPETTVRAPGRIDWAGAGLLSLGLVLLLAAIGNGSAWGWTGVRTIGAVSGGCAALAVWVALERRVAHPFVDLSLVSRGGLGLPMLTGFFFGAELLGSTAANVLFLGLPTSTGFGLGLDPGRLGLALLGLGSSVFLGTWLAPRLTERLGTRTTVVLGAMSMATGYLLTALAHGSVEAFLLWQAVAAVGNGVLLVTVSAYVVSHAPADAVALSSGLYALTRTVGGAVAGAVAVAVMSSMLTRLPDGTTTTAETGYVTVWLVCAALALVVAALALRLGPGSAAVAARGRPGGGDPERGDPVDRVA